MAVTHVTNSVLQEGIQNSQNAHACDQYDCFWISSTIIINVS